MSGLIRDSTFGQLVRVITKNKYFRYREELPDFRLPACYCDHALEEKKSPADSSETHTPPDDATLRPTTPDGELGAHSGTWHHHHLACVLTDFGNGGDVEKSSGHKPSLSSVGTLPTQDQAASRGDEEQAPSTSAPLNHVTSQPIAATKLDDGTVLVDFYATDDTDNPQNWSGAKKALVTLIICLYTNVVYTGSSIYAPAETGVEQRFHVGNTAAALGLALYVLAYGIGPLFFSPISEVALIGRNPPYILSFAIFVLLCIPAALVDNFAGLLVLRFLQGFFGSPSLATGGATLQDMYALKQLPYAMCCWAGAACAGPALGPVISGFSVSAEGWRWALWEMLWLAGPIWVIIFFFLPETYSETILVRRAARLRKLTGSTRFKTRSEMKGIDFGATAYEALVRPVQLMFLDPVAAYCDLYSALCYAIFYSFFEVFPLVYIERYGFNEGEMGLTFLSILVAVTLAIAGYYTWLHLVFEPSLAAHGLGAPERRLIPALYASFLIPTGLFIFAWTGNGHIHWIASCIGIVLAVAGIFILFQCVFIYLPLSYPAYAASLFAGNDFARSSSGFAAILFSRPMFERLGVGAGISLLAALAAGCIVGIFVLYFFGHKLRARSRFAAA